MSIKIMNSVTKIGVIVLFVCLDMCSSGRIKRIIGGMPVKCGEQPRIASLRNATTHLCGATVITADFAITAAHCAQHPPGYYKLHLNNLCTGKNTTYPVAKVVDIVIHKQYDKYSRAHDLAILQIALDLEDASWLSGSVLPVSSFALAGDCKIFGNGYTKPNSQEISKTLQGADVKIISLDQCVKSLGQYVAPAYDSGMLCALGHHSDACQGDSGGPLICENSVLQGVSSYGMGCGVEGLPGVYTSVGAHLKWIHNVIESRTIK